MSVFIQMRTQNRVKMGSSTFFFVFFFFFFVFCSLSRAYFSISNVLCRIGVGGGQTITCQASAQLHSRVCIYVNNLAVLCTCSIDGKVVLQ